MTIADRVGAVAAAEAMLAEARKKWAAVVVEYRARIEAARPMNTPTFSVHNVEEEARAELVNARLDLLEARSALTREG